MSDDAEDHDWVRRVLAETGSRPEPTPDWVGRRVEETLASLREERPGAGDATGAVVEMTPRRHRRWAAGLLAAAALAVGGYSLGATGLLGDAGSGSADSTAAGDTAVGDAGGEAALTDPDGATALSSESLRADARMLAQDVTPEVIPNSDELAALPAPAARDSRVQQEGDSEKVQRDYYGDDLDRAQAGAQGSSSSSATEQQGPRGTLDRCLPPPRSVPGTRRPVSLDSRPATAVLQRLDDGRVRVQVWSCRSGLLRAQVTVRP